MVLRRNAVRHSRPLSLEPLEDRQLLASIQISDINPGGNALVSYLVALDDSIYFSAVNSDGDRRLHATDGSGASIREVSRGSTARFLQVIGDEIVFYDDFDVWKSDGTTVQSLVEVEPSFAVWNDQVVSFGSGEVIFTPLDGGEVKSVTAQLGTHSIRYYSSSGDNFYFMTQSANFGGSSVIWTSDGTQAGTQIVDSFTEPISIGGIAGDSLVYTTMTSSDDDGWTGEIWLADGTTRQMVTQVEGTLFDESSSVLSGFGRFEDKTFFSAGEEVWQTDGTPEGTSLFSNERVWPVWSEGDVTYFLAGEFLMLDFGQNSLWRTDGSFEDAVFLADNVLAETIIENSGDVFFSDNDRVIWSSDGTPQGTGPLEGAASYGGFSPFHAAEMVILKDTLFFAASTDDHGIELGRYTLNPRWHNPFDAGDVNDDGVVAPLDALLILNELNNRQFVDVDGKVNTDPVANMQLDVNADGFISPTDALLAINSLQPGSAAVAGDADDESPGEARNALTQVAASPTVFADIELDKEERSERYSDLVDVIFAADI